MIFVQFIDFCTKTDILYYYILTINLINFSIIEFRLYIRLILIAHVVTRKLRSNLITFSKIYSTEVRIFDLTVFDNNGFNAKRNEHKIDILL